MIFVGQFCSPLVLRPVVSSVGDATTFLLLGVTAFGLGVATAGFVMIRPGS